MPAYPCANCNHQVDLRDLTCRACGEKKPFTCSKCNKRLGNSGVFQAEEIAIKRPLYCMACGREQEALKCAHCRTTIVRRDGIEVQSKVTGLDLIFHPDCHRTYLLQMKVSSVLKFALPVVCGWMGYTFVSRMYPMAGIVGFLVGVLVGLGGAWWMDPKK